MNCILNLPSSLLPPPVVRSRPRRSPISNSRMIGAIRRPAMIVNAQSGSSSVEKPGVDIQEEKSETYSTNMTEAMGAALTYRHELGMNYNFIRPDLIVGSCLQNPSDVDKLREIGVKTIFCLQQDSDLEYFSVDIGAIEEYAKSCTDIEHYRAEIRDFDAFDLRMRLPGVVSELHKAINLNGGVTYIHCTAGLGRAPAVTLAYMFWVQGYKLSQGHDLLQSKRSCFPKLDAIKSATADILAGLPKNRVTLTWKSDSCSSVEVSGLDCGWGQKIPLNFNEKQGLWTLERDLPYSDTEIQVHQGSPQANIPKVKKGGHKFTTKVVSTWGRRVIQDSTLPDKERWSTKAPLARPLFSLGQLGINRPCPWYTGIDPRIINENTPITEDGSSTDLKLYMYSLMRKTIIV